MYASLVFYVKMMFTYDGFDHRLLPIFSLPTLYATAVV